MSASEANVTELDQVRRTVVELDHWLFRKLEGVRFHLHQSTQQPGIAVTMAKNEAFLTLNSVRKEFQIENGTPDGQMLSQIANALKYVKGLLIGDPLPTEVLSGEAHWQVTPRQIAIAHQRVGMKLITLVSTDEPTTDDPAELLALADDPEIKRKINEAFSVAAVGLGLQPEQKQEVVDLVNILAGELSYIEALRDKFDRIDKTREKIQTVRKIYSNKPSVWETSDQVARLMERGKREYAQIFEDIDKRTAEVVPMLRSLDDSIAEIRKVRDDLYVRFLAWDDLLGRWGESHVEFSMKLTELLRDTYQFLAPRFMTFTDWTAMARQEQQRRSKLKVQPMHW